MVTLVEEVGSKVSENIINTVAIQHLYAFALNR